jgi:hypothetical protein
MINVNQITSRLASMPDQALQQYAAMHKNDPYTMALALSESNRRKQMRQGAQMQAPQQPKVVDQEIAGMAQPMPEDTGIAQLPAPNMQSMAEGGIVAFEGGGEVPGYANGLFNAPKVPPGAIIMGNMYIDPATGERRYLPGAEPSSEPNPYRDMSLGDFAGRIKESLVESYKNPSQFYTPADLLKIKTEKQNKAAQDRLGPLMKSYAPRRSDEQQFQADVAARSGLPNTAATGAPPPPPAPDKNKSPLSALVQKPAAPAAPAAPAGLATTPEAVAAELETLQGRQKAENPFAKQIEDLTASERDALTKEKAQFEADIEKAGPAFKEREERLKKRGEKLESQESKLPYMALMEAGLAIMSGTSPNALTNIGAGSAVGLKSYTAGLDKLTEARDKLDDAFGKIEEYRRNEDSMNAKEKRSMQRAINNTYTEAKKLGLAALQKDWELDRSDANKQFDVLSRNRETVYSQTQQNIRLDKSEAGAFARTKMQLNAPPAEARMALMLGTGKTEAERLESGLKKIQDLQSDKTGAGYAKMYAEHVAESRKNMSEPMTPAEFATSMRAVLSSMAPKVVTAPGANAPVYDRPK